MNLQKRSTRVVIITFSMTFLSMLIATPSLAVDTYVMQGSILDGIQSGGSDLIESIPDLSGGLNVTILGAIMVVTGIALFTRR